MKNTLKWSGFLLGILLSSTTWAQTTNIVKCFTDEHYEKSLIESPEKSTLREQTESLIRNHIESEDSNPESVVHTIPVVVHVLYYDEYDNISDEQVQDAIDILNEDFRKLNADATSFRTGVYGNINADMEIEFVLAKRDPNGNCTNGITRTQTELALDDYSTMKSLINWDNNMYLNIWTIRYITAPAWLPPGSTILGYSSFPYVGQPGTDDGIVMRHDRMGTLGTAVPQSEGRTLTHEVGHYFNLFHPFQGGCFQGDQVNDTPPVLEASSGCSFSQNSCNNDNPNLPDMIENYMDYSDEDCQNAFTEGQKVRAKAVLGNNALRGSLTTSANLIATGVSGNTANCMPNSDFSADKRYICVGETVNFDNRANYGEQTNATYAWTFAGGSPATSNAQNPSITYSSPGIYSVELTVTNAQGNATENKANFIQVYPSPANHILSFTEGFETNNVPGSNWAVFDDGNNISWETTNTAAHSGNRSVRLANFDNLDDEFGIDELISDPIEIKFAADATLSFAYAFAKRQASNGDNMTVFASGDCGETWTLIKTLSSFVFTTAPDQANSPFVPNGAGQWKTTTASLNGFIGQADEVLIKFVYNPKGGNNVYLDDINLNVTIGVEEWTDEAGRVALYPNPAMDYFTLDFDLESGSEVSAQVTDLSGRVLSSTTYDIAAGRQLETVNVSSLPTGMYFVQLQSKFGSRTLKVMVQ